MGLALLSAAGITLLSLVGALFLGKKLDTARLHHIILPAAIGVFLGVVFFELIPETLHESETGGALAILFGFLGFYLLSHVLETYHHHHSDNHDACGQGGARTLLIGDAVHNLADGVVIATSFMINPTLGLLTTAGIALHEIPQEIAEYGVLRASGYSPRRALLLNFASSITVVLGVLLTYALGGVLHDYIFVLTGIAAGNLLYIATADLIPELRHSHKEHFKTMFLSTVIGVTLIGVLITLSHEFGGHEEVEESVSHEGAE
jgi:zinc and cadmium transporter